MKLNLKIKDSIYRGRLAPSPTGYLHLGHAHTFWIAYQRSLQHSGHILLRIEDIDKDRCKPQFTKAIWEDILWLGIPLNKPSLTGGPTKPIFQSKRTDLYLRAWNYLKNEGFLYPDNHSREQIWAHAKLSPSGEPIFPPEWRPNPISYHHYSEPPQGSTWRFRVPDGTQVSFTDLHYGPQSFTAGSDFGDFSIWRKDNSPSYELAVVTDDADMNITEVVRGADLLLSTARQILLYQALGLTPPNFYHCNLITDLTGKRLAKTFDSLSLRTLRARGFTPQQLITLPPELLLQ